MCAIRHNQDYEKKAVKINDEKQQGMTDGMNRGRSGRQKPNYGNDGFPAYQYQYNICYINCINNRE